jgi:ribosomal protein S18 acetylase RimI-like enzyme
MQWEEKEILKDLLYEAIYQEDACNPLPREVINNPEILIYIDEWGRADDYCLLAKVKGKIVGGVWTRTWTGEMKGYGYIDGETPEFSISLYPKYRNMGIGTFLMREMVKKLKHRGYRCASLSVTKGNYAINMYQKIGFQPVEVREHDILMMLKLDTWGLDI